MREHILYYAGLCKTLCAMLLIAVIFASLMAGAILADASTVAPPDPGRVATPTPVYIELDAGGRAVILCSGINLDHLNIQPANRHAVYVDCIQGDIEP